MFNLFFYFFFNYWWCSLFFSLMYGKVDPYEGYFGFKRLFYFSSMFSLFTTLYYNFFYDLKFLVSIFIILSASHCIWIFKQYIYSRPHYMLVFCFYPKRQNIYLPHCILLLQHTSRGYYHVLTLTYTPLFETSSSRSLIHNSPYFATCLLWFTPSRRFTLCSALIIRFLLFFS